MEKGRKYASNYAFEIHIFYGFRINMYLYTVYNIYMVIEN